MGIPNNSAEVAVSFAVVAKKFCALVDSAPDIDRSEFVAQVYRVLSKLIDEAVQMPDVERSDNQRRRSPLNVRHQEWERLYNALKEKLGDWNLYRQVFDPTQDNEAIFGSLADDLADIYGDLRKGLELNDACPSQREDAIWEWRVLFYSHWGKHAIDALQAIHSHLQNGTT